MSYWILLSFAIGVLLGFGIGSFCSMESILNSKRTTFTLATLVVVLLTAHLYYVVYYVLY